MELRVLRSFLIKYSASNPYLDKKCDSNPELNRYIKKPKFSRDQYDYNVTRTGYTPRKLVCGEKHTAVKGSQDWLSKFIKFTLINPHAIERRTLTPTLSAWLLRSH